MDMLLAVLSVCSPEELEDDTSSDDGEADRALIDQATTPAMRRARRQRIKNKILAVGKMQVMFQNLRYAARAPRRWTYTHVRHVQ